MTYRKYCGGLQRLYMNEELRQSVFALLESEIAPKVDKRTGRPGMTLQSILICGVLRLDLNVDYDRFHELVSQLMPELLDKLNQVVVEGGHALVKRAKESCVGGCDSCT